MLSRLTRRGRGPYPLIAVDREIATSCMGIKGYANAFNDH